MTSDGQPFHRFKFKSIIEEQVLLGYLTNGGVTYADSNEMSPYERKLALDAIKELKQGVSSGPQVTQINDPKTGQTA